MIRKLCNKIGQKAHLGVHTVRFLSMFGHFTTLCMKGLTAFQPLTIFAESSTLDV